MTILTLIFALIAVESNGNDRAIGDNGLAYGCLQLHAAYVKDAAEYAKKDWTHQDAFDRETSIDIVLAYMSRYATEARLGRPVTAEDIARIHNGGPNGYKKEATVKYWKKVEAQLNLLSGN
jgi:soluble lytic murein transglycosylase-like protein